MSGKRIVPTFIDFDSPVGFDLEIDLLFPVTDIL